MLDCIVPVTWDAILLMAILNLWAEQTIRLKFVALELNWVKLNTNYHNVKGWFQPWCWPEKINPATNALSLMYKQITIQLI